MKPSEFFNTDNPLTPGQIGFFEDNGYLLLKNYLTPNICRELRDQANRLIAEFEPDSAISIFSTKNQTDTSDSYFLQSGDKIRFFFEEDAFSPDGKLKQSKAKSINKIGHALHDLNPLFREFSYHPQFAEILTALGVQSPLLAQSMYIFKQPGIGGEVSCHQDSTFLYTDPLSVIGLWFALEDATVENGCLWAIPGAHQSGLKSRFLRITGEKTNFEIYDKSEWSSDELVPLEASQGTLVLLHGSLPHYSKANFSSQSRHAYTIHVIDGVCSYPENNWLQRPQEMPFRGF
ncbi:MAG: phytanoyl-CoA dioxygenase family protein [SAR324 cluster bacterium]|nr:phytanoyl-CoA dioxygenase family protein [SAR324 cluster bacterium]